MTARRPLVLLAAAFAGGIWAGDCLRVHPALPLGGLGALGGLAAVMAGRRAPEHPAARWLPYPGILILATFLAGALRYTAQRWTGPGAMAAHLGQRVEVVGTVSDVSRRAAGLEVILRAEEVHWLEPGTRGPLPGARRPAGRALVHIAWRHRPGGAQAPPYLAEGRRLAVRGLLTVPRAPAPGETENQRDRLGRQGVFLVLESPSAPDDAGPGDLGALRNAALALRRRLQATLHRALPPEKAALLAGLVLGVREGIPDSWQEAFRLTGVFHVLAASGGNVALIAGPVAWVFRRLGAGPRAGALATLPAIWGYCLIAGAEAPVLRASVTASLYYSGQALGRRADGYTSVAAAALAILGVSPGALFDPGLQLSFLATLGILAFGRPLAAWLGRFLLPVLADPLAATLAASLAVEPFLLVYFGYVSLVSPLTNLWVGFLVQAVVPLGAAAMALGLVIPAAGDPLLLLAGALLPWLVAPAQGLSLLDVAALRFGPVAPGLAVLYYGLLGAVRWPGAVKEAAHILRAAGAWSRAPGARLPGPVRAAGVAGLVGVAAAVGLRAGGHPRPPSGEARICSLHVGGGRAILLELPGGQVILADGGPARPWAGEDAGRDAVLPLLRRSAVRQVDLAVLTVPRTDHAGGLATVLAALPVRELWLAPAAGAPRAVRDVEAMALAGGTRVVPVREIAQWGSAPGPLFRAWRGGEGRPDPSSALAARLDWGRLSVRIAPRADAGTQPAPPGALEVGPAGEVRLPAQAGGAGPTLDPARRGTVCLAARPDGTVTGIRTALPAVPGQGGRLLGAW